MHHGVLVDGNDLSCRFQWPLCRNDSHALDFLQLLRHRCLRLCCSNCLSTRISVLLVCAGCLRRLEGLLFANPLRYDGHACDACSSEGPMVDERGGGGDGW